MSVPLTPNWSRLPTSDLLPASAGCKYSLVRPLRCGIPRRTGTIQRSTAPHDAARRHQKSVVCRRETSCSERRGNYRPTAAPGRRDAAPSQMSPRRTRRNVGVSGAAPAAMVVRRGRFRRRGTAPVDGTLGCYRAGNTRPGETRERLAVACDVQMCYMMSDIMSYIEVGQRHGKGE